MKSLKKYQKKRWLYGLSIPVFLAAFFTIASSIRLPDATVYERIVSYLNMQMGYYSARSYVPLLTYDASKSGKTLGEYLADNVDRLLPIYGYARKKNTGMSMEQYAYLQSGMEESCDNPVDELAREYLEEENEKQRTALEQEQKEQAVETQIEDTVDNIRADGRVKTYSREKLNDFDYLLQNFYRVDSTTTIDGKKLNAKQMLAEDMTLDRSKKGPQILIYHTHSQERFADSKEKLQSVVGLGDLLTGLLEEKGYTVLHHTGEYDVPDRDTAYSRAAPALEQILKENPDIQVIIDLHRDGVAEQTRLVEQINGKQTATIMFFNGLSHTTAQGDIGYLYNPNLAGNLAFSFQMQLAAAEYYPGFSRCIYLKGYRYNLQYLPKSLLVEVGAQTNTWQEAVNAMEPLADILDKVLSGETNK